MGESFLAPGFRSRAIRKIVGAPVDLRCDPSELLAPPWQANGSGGGARAILPSRNLFADLSCRQPSLLTLLHKRPPPR